MTSNDPDINTEKAETIEFGFDFNHGPWSLSGEVFQQRIEDLIVAGFSSRDNAGDARSEGYALRAGYRQGGFFANVGVAHNEPTLDGSPLSDPNMSIGSSSGRTWLATLGYECEETNLKLQWDGKYVEDLDHVPSGADDKKGYQVHDLHTTWKPKEDESLTLTFSVLNIFDEFYHDHTTYGFHGGFGTIIGLPEPGREFRLSVSYTF